MGFLYGMFADFLGIMLFFYVPVIYFLQPRRGRRYVNYLIVVMLMTCWGIPWRYLYLPINNIVYVSAACVITYLALWIFYKSSIKTRLLCFAAIIGAGTASETMACVMLMTMVPNFLTRYVYGQFDDAFLVYARLLGSLASEVVNMIWALVYMCLIRRRKWGIFWGFMLIPVYQFCLTVAFFVMCSDFSEKVAIIGLGIIIFNVVLGGVILYLLEGIFRKLDKEEELRELEKKRRQEYAFYKADSQYVEEMRLIRHDFANQLQAAYGMMDDPDNWEKVRNMLNVMEKNIKNSRDMADEDKGEQIESPSGEKE